MKVRLSLRVGWLEADSSRVAYRLVSEGANSLAVISYLLGCVAFFVGCYWTLSALAAGLSPSPLPSTYLLVGRFVAAFPGVGALLASFGFFVVGTALSRLAAIERNTSDIKAAIIDGLDHWGREAREQQAVRRIEPKR